MYDENQLVEVKWNNTNRKWYESKGYTYTKRYDAFNIPAKDLSPHSDKKINVICDYCGVSYATQYAVVMNGRKAYPKDACSYCMTKKVSDITRQKRAEKHINMAKEMCDRYGYTLLTTVDDYTDTKMNVEFICPKHGKQIMILNNLTRGHKCKPCSYEERGKNLKHDIEYIKEYIENINGNKLLNPEDYKDSVTRNLNILCSCGNIFVTSFSNYSRHGVDTCYSCSCKESVGEEHIRKFLEDNKIEFVQEKRFDDCRDNRPLPFDFYLPNNNLIIEFDGQLHYEAKFSENNFEKTRIHDQIKNDYCKSRSIDLLRIPYWEGNNIDEILTKQLNL